MPNAGVSKLAKAKRLNAHLKNTFKLQSTRTQVINFLAIKTLQKAKPQTII